jgi:4-hydroxybenzoate polyprenyltransferase
LGEDAGQDARGPGSIIVTEIQQTASVPEDAVRHSWVDVAPAWLQPWLRLMRLDRPIGVELLYLPCIFGLALGAGAQGRGFATMRDLELLALFAIGAIVMRGAGCTYNDIVDRDIDAKVARTRGRPIPSGAVSVRGAWIFAALQCGAGLAVLLQLNRFSIALGAGSLVLVALYPFMKRITWWPQAWLGLTFNWGALLGFSAETGRLTLPAFLLYAGCFFWTLGYDTIYAHQDKEDDALVGVKSTARLLGARSRDWILGFYALAFGLILASGYIDHSGWPFTLIMLAAGAHLLWQVHTLDIENPERCLKVFRANRETGAIVAAAFLIASWLP